jgi:hypothetical protein
MSTTSEVLEARERLLQLVIDRKLRSNIRTEFGYWKPEPLRAAKVVPVSTWALMCSGFANCAVCGVSISESDLSRGGRCISHLDWEILWEPHNGSDGEINKRFADALLKIINKSTDTKEDVNQ